MILRFTYLKVPITSLGYAFQTVLSHGANLRGGISGKQFFYIQLQCSPNPAHGFSLRGERFYSFRSAEVLQKLKSIFFYSCCITILSEWYYFQVQEQIVSLKLAAQPWHRKRTTHVETPREYGRSPGSSSPAPELILTIAPRF